MKNDINEIELDINENELDKEWIDQPKKVYRWSEKVAVVRRELEELKSEQDVIRAELDKDIRESPEAYGIVKITETAISSAILLQRKYREGLQAISSKKYELDVLQGFTNALEHRKHALQDLVKLYGQNYFSTPFVDSNEKKSIQELTKKSARSTIQKKLKESDWED